MGLYTPRSTKQPEAKIQDKWIKFLRNDEWIVMPTHGNKFQVGLPDLYCFHPHGWIRWIEIKQGEKYSFTASQMEYFPIIDRVWVVFDLHLEEYRKLWKAPNWSVYATRMKGEHKKPEYAYDGSPEGIIQTATISALEAEGWFVIQTHGNLYQKGFPDLYCVHPKWGHRWVEIKNPVSYSFTPAQKTYFPLMNACGVGIWIITEASTANDLLVRSRPTFDLFFKK